jgi:hypothetical protein
MKLSPVISRYFQNFHFDYRTLLWLGAVVLLYLFYVSGLSYNPPGFYMDESGLAYNAYLIATTGQNEFNVSFPLYFQFYTGGYTQWANPMHIYLLAIPYLFFAPSILVARVFAATMVFAAAMMLGWLALRISGKRSIGIIVALTTLFTPWLFEISRLVLEVFFYPLALVLFLFCLHRAQQKARWTLSDNVLLAVTLGLLTYSYTIGRLLAPLLALGLLIFATNKQRFIAVFKTWIAYGITLLPLVIFNLRHPGLLTARFYMLSIIKPESTWSETIFLFAQRYLEDLSLVSLLLFGDKNPRHHIQDSLGSFFIAPLILALIGIVVVVVRHWHDTWWRYVLYGLAVSLVPGALTIDQFHTLRLITYPVFLLLLNVPALMWLLEENQAPTVPQPKGRKGKQAQAELHPSSKGLSLQTRRAILAVLLVLTAVQVVYFQKRFRQEGPKRGYVFDTAYKEVYDLAVAQPQRPIYLEDGYWGPAYIHALWYATVEGKDKSQFIHLDYGVRPPPGAIVISSEKECTNCQIIRRSQIYLLYRAN